MSTGEFEWFLRNLGAQKILQRLNGMLFSKPGGNSISPSDFVKYDDCLMRVLHEYNRVDLPVVTNMDFGHTDPMMVLPFGRSAQIDVDNKQISILESGVS